MPQMPILGYNTVWMIDIWKLSYNQLYLLIYIYAFTLFQQCQPLFPMSWLRELNQRGHISNAMLIVYVYCTSARAMVFDPLIQVVIIRLFNTCFESPSKRLSNRE